MLRISFPFRLFEAGERSRTSFEGEKIVLFRENQSSKKKEEQRYCCSSESVLYFIENI